MPWVAEALRFGGRVRMTVSGSSMLPFLRDGDTVELEPLGSSCTRGDVVLAKLADDQFVLHRVIRIQPGGVLLAGDAQALVQGPIPLSDLLGRVVAMERGGKQIRPNAIVWRACALVWMALLPWRPWLVSSAGRAKRCCRLWRTRLRETARKLLP